MRTANFNEAYVCWAAQMNGLHWKKGKTNKTNWNVNNVRWSIRVNVRYSRGERLRLFPVTTSGDFSSIWANFWHHGFMIHYWPCIVCIRSHFNLYPTKINGKLCVQNPIWFDAIDAVSANQTLANYLNFLAENGYSFQFSVCGILQMILLHSFSCHLNATSCMFYQFMIFIVATHQPEP